MAVENLQPFKEFSYKTADGETITATKSNGVVTLVGDKNGVRQLPIDQFWQEFIKTVNKVDKTPDHDTVSFSGREQKSNKGLLYTLGAVVLTGLGIGIYALTKGKIGSKAIKNTEKAVNEAAQEAGKEGKKVVQHGTGAAPKSKPTSVPKNTTSTPQAPKEKPVVKTETKVVPEEKPQTVVQQTTPPKPEQTVTPKPEQTVTPKPQQTVAPKPQQTSAKKSKQTVAQSKSEQASAKKPEQATTQKKPETQTTKPEQKVTEQPEQKNIKPAETTATTQNNAEVIDEIGENVNRMAENPEIPLFPIFMEEGKITKGVLAHDGEKSALEIFGKGAEKHVSPVEHNISPEFKLIDDVAETVEHKGTTYLDDLQKSYEGITQKLDDFSVHADEYRPHIDDFGVNMDGFGQHIDDYFSHINDYSSHGGLDFGDELLDIGFF